ncbi:MAG: hypothetical protein OXH38_02345 [Chloroflexi bacterium]|nr:hypothetical protein [Chloroflexota bacterium]
MPLDERGLWSPADFSELRSERFSTPRLGTELRARRAHLRGPKRDRHGREYLGRDHALLGHGFHDAREAERLLLDTAAAQGLSHESVDIEAKHWLETEINAGLGPN